MLEKEIEKKFRRRITEAGGWAPKFVSPGLSGVPDRIVFFPGGRICFVELKRPGGRLRTVQKRIIEKMRGEVFIREVMADVAV